MYKPPKCFKGITMENYRKTMQKPWDNPGKPYRKTIGKLWERHGKTMENCKKTMGKP